MERQRTTVHRDPKTYRYGGQGKAIRRTSDATPPSVEYMSVGHGRTEILVAQEHLYGPEIVAVIENQHPLADRSL